MSDDSLSRVQAPVLPLFDLVVATVGRTAELDRLFDSLERQSYRGFRVLVVDQNEDRRLESVVEARASIELLHLRAPTGLARARNVALVHVEADVVAFPDDDCVYADDLLFRTAQRLRERPELDGVLGRTADAAGRSSDNWPAAPQPLTPSSVWHCSNSNSIFLRRQLVHRTGAFDESLGLGSGRPWSSGEETEYLVRALRLGARIEYDPALVVHHADRPLTPDLGRRDGASTGYILAKHSYPPGTLARMLVRPSGGALLALARGDAERARFYWETIRGRLVGFHGGRRAS